MPCYIKVVRTDKGGKYISREFENFCKVHGINSRMVSQIGIIAPLWKWGAVCWQPIGMKHNVAQLKVLVVWHKHMA